MALIIAGERSGVGKTTITLALLAALCRVQGEAEAASTPLGHLRAVNREMAVNPDGLLPQTADPALPPGLTRGKAPSPESPDPALPPVGSQFGLVQAFKVGPDYIDPMFHSAVTGRPCRNLDPVLTSEDYVRSCFDYHSQSAPYSLIEGVMGLFDGVETPPAVRHGDRPYQLPDYGSTAHIARLLNVPVVLVLDCSHLSGSVAAIVQGYRSFDPLLHLAGVVLNRVGSDRHLRLLTLALETIQMPIVGVLRRQGDIAIPDRHLGLVPAGELTHLDRVLDCLAHLGRTCFDWHQLQPLLSPQRPMTCPWPERRRPVTPPETPVRLAVAQDAAFNFYYADNLDLLQVLGAELVPWSPLQDRQLPPGVQGLYLGGGFPELFATALADNQAMKEAVRSAIAQGMPTYGECGGLMYLCETLVDLEGVSHAMVGVIPGTVSMAKRLTLGYRRAIALADGPVVCRGQTVWGHEFHRSQWQPFSGRSQHLESLNHGLESEIADFTAIKAEYSTQCLDLADGTGDRTLFQIQALGDLFPPPGHIAPSQPEGWHSPHLHGSYVHLHWGAKPELAQRFIDRCRPFQPLA